MKLPFTGTALTDSVKGRRVAFSTSVVGAVQSRRSTVGFGPRDQLVADSCSRPALSPSESDRVYLIPKAHRRGVALTSVRVGFAVRTRMAGTGLITRKVLMAGVLVAGSGCLIGVSAARADPLIPPTPAEVQYLEQARRILPGSGDSVASNGDGDLLQRGRFACYQRDVIGLVGVNATFVSPILTQLAFIYLCPK